ncbi:MAG: PilZ domain-containing protein [Deltaproteobacteria bacterium]|nr:PilZ domain-containing protein [Deltaproteobacteria bacterium]
MQTAIKKKPEDHRTFQRQPLPDSVVVRTDHDEVAQGIDVSYGGISVQAKENHLVGDTLDLLLMDRNVMVKGVVSSSRPDQGQFRLGVSFERTEDVIVDTLLESVDQKKK